MNNISNYGTMDFDNILDEVGEEVDRICNEMDIYKFTHEENVYTYNRLTNILLELKAIK